MNFKVGDEFEMVFPFTSYETYRGGRYEPEITDYWSAGCEQHQEQGEYGCLTRYFTAHDEGKVIYKVLALVELSGKRLDRVVFERRLIDPDGEKYGRPDVRMLTKTLFERDIKSVTPFKAEYELEE